MSPFPWTVAAVAACAAGMASKEICVGVPLLVLLYDALFAAGSPWAALRRRWPLYAGLAATWAVLAVLVLTGARTKSVGFAFMQVTTWQYVLTQFDAIVLYLRLAVWPDALCLDYGWPKAGSVMDVWWQMLVVGTLLAGTVCAIALGWKTRRGGIAALGFLGAWFFVILAPTSSVLPIVTETIAEHRMYLPLAAVVSLAVGGLYRLGGWAMARLRLAEPTKLMIGWAGGGVLTAAVVAGLCVATQARNRDYRDELAIWTDATAKRPDNPRAWVGVGYYLQMQGRVEEALAQYDRALALCPEYDQAHCNKGNALGKLGRYDQAIDEFRLALRARPNYAAAWAGLGHACQAKGDLPGAVQAYGRAVALRPDEVSARNGLGEALAAQGRMADAFEQFRAAVALAPGDAQANLNMARAMTLQGDARATRRYLEVAVKADPDCVEAVNNLAWLLATNPEGELRDGPRAVDLAIRACRLAGRKPTPGVAFTGPEPPPGAAECADPTLLDTLAAAYAEAGRFDEAGATMVKAIAALLPDGRKTIEEYEARLESYRAHKPFQTSPTAATQP